MSQLARDAAGFRNVLSRQDPASWHSASGGSSAPAPTYSPAPTPPAQPEASTSGSSLNKKSRPKSNVVYSQPTDTHYGTETNTQLVYAISHLKSSHNPMRLQDIAILLNIPIDTDPVLREKFREHKRVFWDRKTDLYSYKHDFLIHSKLELRTSIQRSSTTGGGGGIPVKVLKESWKDAPSVVEELEKDGEVLVTRTAKDGQPRMVFWNEIQGEKNGGAPVEKEFSDLWHSLKTPTEPELLRALTSSGLAATAAAANAPKGPAGGKKKGKRSGNRQRATKITNTHLRLEMDELAAQGIEPKK